MSNQKEENPVDVELLIVSTANVKGDLRQKDKDMKDVLCKSKDTQKKK